MNLAVAFVIIIYFFVSEFTAPQTIADPWTRVCVMMLLLFAVPAAALFQTRILANRYRKRKISFDEHQTLQKRMSINHTAVWLCASIAIIAGVRWHDIVRGQWQLDRWPILDELVIVAPVLFALVGSWAIFYDIDRLFVHQSKSQQDPSTTSTELSTKQKRPHDWKSRLKYVSIRFRVHVLMILVPLLFVALVRDTIPSGPPEKVIALGALFAILFAAIYPFLLMFIWNTRPLKGELETELFELCRKHRMGVCMIRVWKTDYQILNAAIAGLVPGLRMLVLTDGMLLKFSKDELEAVVRHEAGHIRRHHFARRIAAVVVPLIILFLDQQLSFGVHATLEYRFTQLNLSPQWAVAMISCLYVMYLWFVSRWLFRKMEFEADLYSVGNSSKLSIENRSKAEALISALQKFAAYCPEQFEKGSGLHPPLRNRIARIAELT